jgi:hypothetical protein
VASVAAAVESDPKWGTIDPMDLTEGVGEHQEGDPKDLSVPPHLTSLLTLSRHTGQTIDDRLAAVLESIREWDWRAGTAGHPSVAPVRPLTAKPPALRTAPGAPAPPVSPAPRDPSARPSAPRARVQPDRPVPAPHLRVLPAAAAAPPPPSPVGPFSAAPPERTVNPPLAPPSGPPSTPPEPTLAGRPGGNTDAVRDDAPTGFEAPAPQPITPVPHPPIRLLQPEPGPGAQGEPKTLTVPIVPPSPDSGGGTADDAPAATVMGPSPEEAARHAQRWPKNFGRIALVLVTVLIVVVIVAIIRKSADNNPSGGSLTPTSVTHTTSASTPALIPVSSSVKSAFSATSVDLTAANTAVTRALAGGAAQSPAQVAEEVAPYVTALDTFNYKNHFLVWPAALQVPAEDLTLRTDELIHYLSSISSASPATLTSWFAQFHSLARLNQTTNNALRKDIGLPALNSYPT